jgi:hypothetical protein
VAFAAAAIAVSASAATASSVRPQRLEVESRPHPIGIAVAHPSFSWTLAATNPARRGLGQSGYRILVASSAAKLASGEGDLWDSGEQRSAAFLQIEYAGKPLQSHATYYWKLRVADQDGRESAWSAPASFATALLSPSDWKAKWIAAEPDAPTVRATEDVDDPKDKAKPLPIFRRAFALDRPVKQALVFVTGLGQYELLVNGANITDTVLNPGWTDYRKTVEYETYDVTRLLRRGANVFGVMLGNGMYNVPNVKGRYTKFTGSFGQPKLVLQMHVTFDDGGERDIVSDGSWKTAPGPITFSSVYGGEDYDARKAQPGWDAPGFNDKAWQPALEVAGPGGALSGKIDLPIQVEHVYAPVKVTEPAPGVLVYDLGQNFAGWPEIAVRGKAGAKISMLAGELLDEHGRVTQKSAHAFPDDPNLFDYTLRGGGAEIWHPRFSYYGFRYVEVRGATRTASASLPQVLSLKGDFLHDAVATDGEFSTSDALFDRIHKLIDMAILSNMVSVLTDCPHREKLGWLEQTHLAGASIMQNYDVDPLYRKMADDMADSQLADGLVPSIAPEYVAFVNGDGKSNAFRDSPEWGSAVVLSPWTAYQFYGDKQLLASHYAQMRRYVAYLGGKAQDHMLSYGLGDWYDIGPGAPGESQLTGKSVTATATYYEDLVAMAKIAAALAEGDHAREFAADSERYAAEAEAVKTAFNAKLFHPETNSYDRGSQTANAMPLALGIVPEDKRKAVLDNLVADIRKRDNHVTAGDIGFQYVIRALSDGGRSDVLYDMLSRTDSPSYGYQLAKGATSLTEAWDTNPASSQNHFMLGHGEEWFYRGLAGIDLEMSRAAPQKILIRPEMVGDIAKASASYDSALGPIASSWTRAGNTATMKVTIPPGAEATVSLPAKDAAMVSESGKPLSAAPGISNVRVEKDRIACTVGSGEYNFDIQQLRPSH